MSNTLVPPPVERRPTGAKAGLGLAALTAIVVGSMIGVFVYGTIKTVISFLGVDKSWIRITIGALLLVSVVVQRLLVARTARTSR